MQFFVFLAAYLLTRRLQNHIKFSPLRVKWNTMLSVTGWVIIAAYIGAESAFNDNVNLFLGTVLLSAILYYLYQEPDFKPLHFFINSYYPIIAAGLINSVINVVAPKFYHEYDNYFQFAVLGGFVWIFARSFSSKKQEKEIRIASQRNYELDQLVAQRTAELTRQKDELQETVKLLQATQQQLIQSEKLASLGELTAGIAHEIQNPLNFVNNFSEVSMELFEEMEEELAKGDTGEVLAIAGDIKQNLEKIRHHGKRADGIVKGMLQHSRASSNVMEPTDINALADEYLRLAYHGLRAKDKTFNAELISHFAADLPKVNVVPQDVGRVLLNLFNNAFYAVQQKQKTGAAGYKPTVEINTRISNATNIEVRVKDNGTGIPNDIKDKILQPFFTTKPTGEGTGLGLSLSYDIIVKAHGGKMDINSTEGECTEFVITIPV